MTGVQTCALPICDAQPGQRILRGRRVEPGAAELRQEIAVGGARESRRGRGDGPLGLRIGGSAARRGRRVVRLKGGDPFVFGRGGEEMLALQHAGVRFDVVPGVTSVSAAPALAGIPLTHRGVASAFLVVSGHEADVFRSAIGQLTPNGVTVVVLMGLARSAAIASELIDRGWSRGTPAAIIVDGWTPQQQVWRGTLDGLAADATGIDASGAGTIVIGDVVTVGIQMAAAANGANFRASFEEWTLLFPV